jgi:hypothetical protein
MEQENYDDLLWDIDDTPVASSTPDEFHELSYRATSECPDCGAELNGYAQYWSRSPDMSLSWLERIDYEYCECQLEKEQDEDDWSDFDL